MSGIIQFFSQPYFEYVSPEGYVFKEENESASEDAENQNPLVSASSSDEEISESGSVSDYEDYHFRKSDSDSESTDGKINKLALTNLKEEEISDSEEEAATEETDNRIFNLFPDEISFHIFGFLRPEELARYARVCKLWNRFVNDEFLWQAYCQNENINQLIKLCSTWKKTYLHSSGAFLLKCIKSVEPQVIKTLKGHSNQVTSLQLQGTILVSGSWDKTIKVWDLSTGQCVRTLKGHSLPVKSLRLQGTTLVSGADDNTIKIWDLSIGECIKTLVGHSSAVSSLQLQGTTLVSGSWDKTTKIWDLSTGECIKTLVGHSGEVISVQLLGTTLVSGSRDRTIKVWDLSTGQCVRTLKGHSSMVSDLQLQGSMLVSGSCDDTIKVWDLSTGECVKTLKAYEIASLLLQGSMLVSGSYDDNMIKVWDLSTGECIKTLNGHFNHVKALQLQGTTLVSGAADNTILIWDFAPNKLSQ